MSGIKENEIEVEIDPIVPSSSKGLGNTKTRPKQEAPRVNWCFTLNNYVEKDIKCLEKWC